MLMATFTRFAYLVGNFNVWWMFQVFYIAVLCLLLFSSEGILGEKNSIYVRTYFNILDINLGKGIYIVYISIILMEKNNKGESFFTITSIIIGIINIIVGYKDTIK